MNELLLEQIHAFAQSFFRDCFICHQYNPDQQAISFAISFHEPPGQYQVTPPPHCRITGFQCREKVVKFTMEINLRDFVEGFLQPNFHPIQNVN